MIDNQCPKKQWFIDTTTTIIKQLLHHKIIADEDVELVIRLVDTQESQTLNHTYRNQNKPTNILSFNHNDDDLPASLQLKTYLGDLIVCFDVVKQEAKIQHKTIEEHSIHLLIHGILHLLGYDHIKLNDQKTMETLEDTLLSQFNIYLERQDHYIR